ncbi:hypothetical protein MTO98_07195 [Mucilaginibacter sp. SMC90]|uniref:hypothetical protein n=1 Tax=Mucilaginibacter sp. SMC90 TaxID=2929803 RepID=UPI001FB29D0C|nr:hypothetical protein [Mucilaginibacter sp. SMC90]UOE50861.1 hypothetical protein MTO98_07195 [Mucilaginibacter sp. SMC90]
MKNLMQILPVSFDGQSGKYRMIIPSLICDNLLLSYTGSEGLLLCNKDRQLLERLKTEILSENQMALDRYEKFQSNRWYKLSLGFAAVLAVGTSIVFEKDMISDEAYKWPFNIAASLLMVSLLYYIFINYTMVGRTRRAESLRDSLSLVRLHQEIKVNFQC